MHTKATIFQKKNYKSIKFAKFSSIILVISAQMPLCAYYIVLQDVQRCLQSEKKHVVGINDCFMGDMSYFNQQN